jgi:hypothetical protein
VPRPNIVPPNFFENIMNRTLCTVLVMANLQGVPRRKKGWPQLSYITVLLKFDVKSNFRKFSPSPVEIFPPSSFPPAFSKVIL